MLYPQDLYNYYAQQRINSLLGQSSNPPQAGNVGINWVNGMDEVKAFKLPPNANALFLDSEHTGMMYIKLSDELGMCKVRTFRFQEVETANESRKDDASQYIRKDELPALILELLARKKEETNEQPVQ